MESGGVMSKPLMPKATALWLVENTSLTFQQIADFCELHPLEIQAIADGDSNISIVSFDPINSQQLTLEEIQRCEKDPTERLKILPPKDPIPSRKKVKKYTPVSKRSERPDAIAWLLRNHPELNDLQITRLIGTTKTTIEAVRSRTHRNVAHIKPRCPVTMGICSQLDLDSAVEEARKHKESTPSQPAVKS
jgi:hypothetical protein